MSNEPRNVGFFSAAVKSSQDSGNFKPLTAYTEEMCTWLVVDMITTHDHLFKHLLQDAQDNEALYPFFTDGTPRQFKIQGSNNLIKTFLVNISKKVGRPRPADQLKCRPSRDIETLAIYMRQYYQNCTSLVFCLEPIQYNMHTVHRKRLLESLRKLQSK